MAARPPPRAAPPLGPLVPVELCDVPTQRLYIASAFALLQAYKLWHFVEGGAGSEPALGRWGIWTLLDAIVLGSIVPALRVPRLRFGVPQRVLLILLAAGLNWVLFGNWSIGWSSLLALIPSSIKSIFDYETAVLEHRVRRPQLVNPSDHILGQVTVHILPHSTAKLNPSSRCYCIRPSSPDSDAVTIPILFNNSSPHLLQYSVQDFSSGEVRLLNVSHKAITAVSRIADPTRKKTLEDYALEAEAASASASGDRPQSDTSNWWALSAPDQKPFVNAPPQHELHHRLPSSQLDAHAAHGLERTQSLYQITVREVGLIRLERVLDKAGNDIRIARADVLVVRCPDATFANGTPSAGVDTGPLMPRKGKAGPSAEPGRPRARCVSDEEDFGIEVTGLPPLSLTYHREVNRARTQHKLEGISPAHLTSPLALQPPSDASSSDLDAASLAKRLSLMPRDRGVDYSWAAAQTISVPLNVSLSGPGSYVYRLDTVRDACGHSLDLAQLRDALLTGKTSPSSATQSTDTKQRRMDVKSVEVYPRAQVAFMGCGVADEPVRLLRGRSADLDLRVKDKDKASSRTAAIIDAPWTASVRYTPPNGDEAANGWTKDISVTSRAHRLSVNEPGTYELASFRGSHCGGEILAPYVCTVVEQPLPTISFNTIRLTDQCSGEIGVKASFVLSGAPPFKVHYSVAQKGQSGPPQRRVKTAQHSRDDITIQPDTPGTWTYVFDRLEDRYYDDVRISETLQQVVHPLASAQWRRHGDTEVLWSCGGETVKAEVELRGAGPFTIEYQIIGGGKRETLQTVKGVNSPRATVDVAVPQRYAKNGGKFMVSLVSIEDGNGCKRPLTVPDLPVEVHRTKPTARFYDARGERVVMARQDEEVNLPLRLTGEAPWTITYRHRDSGATRDVALRSPNAQLAVRKSGTYELVGMRDKRCPGTVSETDFRVEWLPRPRLRLGEGAGELSGGVFVRKPVCELADDSFDLVFNGSPPFTAWYQVLRHSKHDGLPKEKALQAVQSGASLQLFTAEAGVHEYEITALSDSVYTSRGQQGLVDAHRSGVIRLQQEVHPRPTGQLKALSKASFCVSETLASTSSRGVRLELTGRAPFDVELEVLDESTKVPERFSVHLELGSSFVDLPYAFRTPGSHTVSLRRIRDAHGCERTVESSATGSMMVEVAEIASIAPVTQRSHHCVGDSLDFVLQGSPPWTVRYEFNGKKSSATISAPRFSRLAKEPGVFRITGVSHQLDQCTAKVDLEKTIRPVPTALVSAGKNIVQDIREGDQTELVFRFTGEPPFSFTYQRAPPQDRTQDRRVLETHTVTGIMEHQYSIFAREEGTWSVTYVQDAYCSFPPAGEGAPSTKRIKAS